MKVLAFGEILWDVFGTERKIGGAPFNFSAHCARLGAEVDYITAVGRDEPGNEALKYIEKYGVSTDFVMRSSLMTGCCNVTLRNGVPNYELVYPTAYDDICITKEFLDEISSRDYDYLYCGTLALRGESSRASLFKICESIDAKLIVDVNIRQSFYSGELLDKLFSRACILKISREELPLAAGCLGFSQEHDSFVSELFGKYGNLSEILLTLDKDGAVCCLKSGERICSEKPKSKAVSTVGAGDSFTAAYLVYSSAGLSHEAALNKAVELSDFVVRFHEAIPE